MGGRSERNQSCSSTTSSPLLQTQLSLLLDTWCEQKPPSGVSFLSSYSFCCFISSALRLFSQLSSRWRHSPLFHSQLRQKFSWDFQTLPGVIVFKLDIVVFFYALLVLRYFTINRGTFLSIKSLVLEKKEFHVKCIYKDQTAVLSLLQVSSIRSSLLLHTFLLSPVVSLQQTISLRLAQTTEL